MKTQIENLEDLKFISFFDSLQVGNNVLSYKGYFSTSVLDDLLSMIEARLVSMGEKEPVRKRIFAVCVEMLQNLFHRESLKWNPTWKNEYQNVIFRLDKDSMHYQIAVGNYMDEMTKYNLISKIDEVNTLDKSALKEKYREVLQTTEFTSKGGAGLGIIDVARRSNEALGYRILPVDENYCFFCILAKVTT